MGTQIQCASLGSLPGGQNQKEMGGYQLMHTKLVCITWGPHEDRNEEKTDLVNDWNY